MGFGLSTKKNRKLRGRLFHRSCSPAACLFALLCSPGLRQLCCWWGGSSLLPSVQQLLDTPAAEEDVGNFLQGALQALPPGAHLYNRLLEPGVWQGPSKGEG